MSTYQDLATRSADYDRISGCLTWLTENYTDQPSLERVAAESGLSEFHFQRLFSRWTGLSPKRYVQFLTLAHAKACLSRSASVLDAAYDSGLSGPGRLHDLFVKLEAVSPGEFKTRGAGTTIRYAFHDTPFGECLVGYTGRGLCGIAFTRAGDRDAAFADLGRGWENARLVADPTAGADLLERLFGGTASEEAPVGLCLRGTPFQIKVWEALLKIPSGAVSTYEDVALRIDRPGAVRAVASATAANTVAYLIPCHRVIRKTGALGGYHWGPERKLAMLSYEAARAAG